MKPVILLYDVESILHAQGREIVEWMGRQGFEVIGVGVEMDDPIRVIDLSNLPLAEIEELRQLCREKASAYISAGETAALAAASKTESV